MNWTRCQWCNLLLLLPEPEPLNPYIVELGGKLTGRWYHEECLKEKLRGEGVRI